MYGELWNDPRVRTDLLMDGQDTKTNINVSVRLSINSRHMQSNPESLTLLALLSHLPALQNGVTDAMKNALQTDALRTIPGVQPCDGFFAAVLERA